MLKEIGIFKFNKCQLASTNKIKKGKKIHYKPHATELFPVSKFTVVTANLSQNASDLLSLKLKVNKELK